MKKTILAIAVCIAVLACNFVRAQGNIQVAQGNPDQLSIMEDSFSELSGEFNTPEFRAIETHTDKGLYTRLFIAGKSSSGNYGSPEMPSVRKLIRVPLGAKAAVSITKADYTDFDLSAEGYPNKVYPAQPPRSKSDDTHEFVFDQQAYMFDGFIEHELVSVQMLGILRDKRIARLNFSPFQYNPVQHILRVYHHIEYTVKYEGADIPSTKALEEKYASPCFGVVDNSILNKNTLESKDNFMKYPIKYVIIADRMFESQLQPFIEWKTKKGFHIVETYTDDIGNSLSAIKSYIQQLYDAGSTQDPAPSYVLFVGDIQQIPAWDNGNGATDRNYCEFTGDLFPEIYYGRFSAQNPTQLQPFIDKTLQYEKYTMPDPSYLDEVVMVAGMDGSHGYDWGNGQINYGTINYFNPDHGISSHTYLYPNSGPSAAQIRQDISNGVTFGNYTAHCSPNGWSDPSFEISHIPALQNQDMYCVLVGNCCSSSEYQLSECFAEAIVRAENKGAVGYIGASNSTYWDEDYYFGVGVGTISQNPPPYEETSLGYYDRAFHDHGEDFVDWYVSGDEMIFAGNLAVTEGSSGSAQYYWDIYNFMGDPSIMVYFSNPPVIAVNYAPLLPLQSTSFTVTTEAFAYVALSLDEDLIDAVLADENGIAELQFDPLSISGTADVVVTKQNGQPFFGTVLISSPSGPYLVLDDVEIDDATGNQNGQVDFGESVLLDLSLENVGYGNASFPTTTLLGSDPNITVNKDFHQWPDIPGQTIHEENGTFSIDIAPFVPDQYTVSFEIEVEAATKETWLYEYFMVINAPVLCINELVIDDSQAGNDNGRLDPGETAIIKVVNTNTGHCPAENTVAVLTSTSQYLDFTSNTFAVGTLGMLGFVYSEFEVVVDDDAPDGAAFAEFDYTLTSGDYSASKNFRERIGLIIEDFETGDFSKFDWVMGGDADWQVSSIYPYEGVYSGKSGQITDSETSEIMIDVDVMLADTVFFVYKTASQMDDDLLKFYIDNSLIGEWSGIGNGWNDFKAYVPDGMHTLKWVYAKDDNGFAGEDCAWLDNIIFPPLMCLTCYAGPDDYTCDGGDYQCQGEATDWISVNWTTSGDGTFSDPNILNPIYTPGSDDITSGSATLTISVEDSDGLSVDDEMDLSVIEAPETPDSPEGPDHVVIPSTMSSVYTTNPVAFVGHYDWMVDPADAGTISGTGVEGAINWNLSFAGTATIAVRAINNCGESVYSEGFTVMVDNIVGVAEGEEDNILMIYPNPNNGNFNIISDTDIVNASISIYSILGEKVYHENTELHSGQVWNSDIENYPKGMYIIAIESAEISRTEKLIIR